MTESEIVEKYGAAYGWHGSIAVENTKLGILKHDVDKVQADNVYEAIGLMYMGAKDRFPEEDGWGTPDVVVDETPVLILPNVEAAIAVAEGSAAETGTFTYDPSDPALAGYKEYLDGLVEKGLARVSEPNEAGVVQYEWTEAGKEFARSQGVAAQ